MNPPLRMSEVAGSVVFFTALLGSVAFATSLAILVYGALEGVIFPIAAALLTFVLTFAVVFVTLAFLTVQLASIFIGDHDVHGPR